jgi:hypothetical protein
VELVPQIDLSKSPAKHTALQNQITHLEHDLFLTILDQLRHSHQDLLKQAFVEDHEEDPTLVFEPLQADLPVVFLVEAPTEHAHPLQAVAAFLAALEEALVPVLEVHVVDMLVVDHGVVLAVPEAVDEDEWVNTLTIQNLYTNLIKKPWKQRLR